MVAMISCNQFANAQFVQQTKAKQIASEGKQVNNTIVNKPLQLTPVYDFSDVRICVDPIVQTGSLPLRRTTAGNPIPKINADGTISQVSMIQQGLVAATEKMWNPGDVIKVWISKSNGSPRIWDRIQFYAKEWEKFANIKFEFVNSSSDAQVRVGLFKTNQSWSWVGRDVLFNPGKEYTMNFGWFNSETTETQFSRTVMHEFGHVLGFRHEHQSPASPLEWDKEKTYKFFKEKNNWTPAEVDANIINKFTQNNTNFSAYDPNSIMHYDVPQALLLSGNAVTGSYMTSGTDEKYARYWYPFPPTGVNTSGNLRTNDDCDDVAFKVEYDVVPADKIEFTLSLGEANNNKVTWWKQVTVPMNNNTETELWVQNYSLIKEENRTTITIQVPDADINKNKGISFWKAKFLGIHTLLPYKWNVLTAIKGGCRITLVWNRDTCR